MILITTAGKIGAEAARLLADRAEPVRILVRDPQKATALAEAGVEVAVGDLEIPATIDRAIEGVSAVVLVSPAIPAQELNVVDSAVRAGVGHVVKVTSKASADSPIARRRDQTEIETGLIASGLDYTLLRNNAYMQNFLMLAPAIANTSSFGSSTGDGRVGMVDTRAPNGKTGMLLLDRDHVDEARAAAGHFPHAFNRGHAGGFELVP